MKNLKTVSRNWGYFVVLFICPLILIGLSGLMLNSTDFKNSRIGITDAESNIDNSDLNELTSLVYFSSLDECLFSLEKGNIVACIDSKKNNEGISVKVYLDNSRKAVIYYVKQSVLQSMLKGQSSALEKSSEEIKSTTQVYSEYIKKAKKELDNTYSDLSEQENLLTEYKKNLTILRQNFNNMYFAIKRIEPEINNLRSDLSMGKAGLQADISNFKLEKANIISTIGNLKNFLYPKINYEDYTFVSSQLNSILKSLNKMDDSLNSIEKAYTSSSLSDFLDSFPDIVKELDSIKLTLDAIDQDLDTAIYKTQLSKQRIKQFSNYLDEASNEINELSNTTNSGKVNVEFKENTELADRPVLLSFPLLIAIIITFTSIVLSNMFVLRQINQPSYLRSIITPTRDISFLMADYLINIFFIAVQIFVLSLIGVFILGLSYEVLFMIGLTTFLAATIFIFTGMSLGYLIKSQSISMLVSVFLVMILLIMSDFLVPSILASPIVKFFIDLNPFVILNKSLEYSILLNKDFYYASDLLLGLAFFCVIMFFVAYASKKISRFKAIK